MAKKAVEQFHGIVSAFHGTFAQYRAWKNSNLPYIVPVPSLNMVYAFLTANDFKKWRDTQDLSIINAIDSPVVQA